MKIGFVGLGNMGLPMARNLSAAGYDVHGYDPVAEIPAQITAKQSAAEAADGADIVLTMLPNAKIVLDVAAQVLPVLPEDALYIDCSTVDVETSKSLASAGLKAQVSVLDAPVSGGAGGATAGTLTFMVGGTTEAFVRARPLLDVMGGKIVHCGDAGAGQSAKICNNMILGATMVVTCEAFALAEKLGLDRQVLFDVVSTSSGASWSTTTYCPVPGVGPETPADHDYAPGFAAALMLKDLGLSQQVAEAVGAATPLGRTAHELYETFVNSEGQGDLDFSAVLPWIASQTRS